MRNDQRNEMQNEEQDTSLSEDLESNEGFDVAVIADRDEELYGCFGWAPEYLQCFRKHPIGFLIVLCILESASTYVQYGSFPAAIPHIGREFDMKSEVIAQIRLFYDVGALVILFPVVYYGTHGVNRPQAIAFGGVAVALGVLVICSAHFLLSASQSTRPVSEGYCTDQAIESESRLLYKYVLLAGEFLVGVGAMPAAVIGVTYLDENVTHRESPLYTAILSICELIGPMLGYLITGEAAKGAAASMRQVHTYAGRWWIGMLVGALIALVGAVLMFPFPRQLSGAVATRIKNMREALKLGLRPDGGDAASTDDSARKKLKELFSNRVFLGTMIEQGFRSCVTAGFATFLVAHIRNALDASSSLASILVGSGVISAALLGFCFGTFLQHMLRLHIPGNLRIGIASAFITLIVSAVLFKRCPQKVVKGIDDKSPFGQELNLSSDCNKDCNCDGRFSALCYFSSSELRHASASQRKPKGETYFSKCYVGCTMMFNKTSYNCECLSPGGQLTSGACQTCSPYNLYAFMIGVCWIAAAMFARANPIRHVQLRCVSFKLRVWALGFSTAFSRITAGSGVMLFAWVKRQSCSHLAPKGIFCSFYDHGITALYLFILVTAANAFCLIALVFAMKTNSNATDSSVPTRTPPTKSSDDERQRKPQLCAMKTKG